MMPTQEQVALAQQTLVQLQNQERQQAELLKPIRQQGSGAKALLAKHMVQTGQPVQRVGDCFIETKETTTKHPLNMDFVLAIYVAFNEQFKDHIVTPDELACFKTFVETQRIKLGQTKPVVKVRARKQLDSLVFRDR